MICLDDLLCATNGVLYSGSSSTEFVGFAFDSRQVKPGQLFLAVKTATGDGHDFIADAVRIGATGVLCESRSTLSELINDVTVVIVPDVHQALIDYAAYILRKYRPKVIGVTGSSGKTTTKEAIATVLQERYCVFKNPGSYNGRYGLSISLGQIRPEHQIAVLEIACNGFGQIAELARITQPQVGIVTNIHQAHLAYLGTLDNIAAEKGRLIEALPPTGTAILNADDPRVAKMGKRTEANILTFGLKTGVNVRASDITPHPDGLNFVLHYKGESYQGYTALLGQHQIYVVLAAVTTALTFDIPPERALAAIANLPRVSGRLNLLLGKDGTVILDDTFSASPEATLAALDTLAEMPYTTKVAILGDIPELGDIERETHRQIGHYAAKRIHHLVTKGEAAQEIGVGALENNMKKQAVHVTFTSSDAIAVIQNVLSPNTVILVKGGLEARMEQVVQKLLAQPGRDSKQLVRQSSGWAQVRARQPARPTWVEIDLDAIANNVRLLAEMAAPAKILAVLKADAYGHGMIKGARTALYNGASWVGVATLGEAITLRKAGVDAPILIMSYIPAWQAREAIIYNASVTVFSKELARAFSRAATELARNAHIHVKVDTGLGRLGLLPDDVLPFLESIQLPNLKVEGLYTHFATADEADLSFAKEQLHRFQNLLSQLEQAGLRPPLVHAANTAALINLPDARFEMVRSGIGLYGLAPAAATPLPPGFRPALTFKSTIGQIKTLPPNSPVGYGASYRTKGEETIAIVPVGYADGFRRAPRTWGEVLVKGQRAPLVGRVSMDQCAINVTHVSNVRQGDEVVLIGQQGNEVITAEEVADRLGTINYEVVSELLARIPRMF